MTNKNQVPIDSSARADDPEADAQRDDGTHEVTADVAYRRLAITQDWDSAHSSVVRLASLEPDLAVTGHGRPMQGDALREALHKLAENFDIVAVPDRGKYVDDPATPEDGTAYDSP